MNNYIKTLAVFLFLALGTTASWAQKAINAEIDRIKDQGIRFEQSEEVFQIATTVTPPMESYFIDAGAVTLLQYNNSILKNQNPYISMEIPYKGSIMVIDLMDVTSEFQNVNVEVRGDQEYTLSTQYKHYRGVVRGDDQSLVAINFFDDNVMGVISTNEGNINIVKMKDSDEHIVYDDNNVKGESKFACSTEIGDFEGYDPQVLSGEAGALGTNSGNCVGLYFETEVDIFQNLGSVANVQNYVSALYNAVATIYSNENIATTLSDVVIWTTTDPYTSTGTAGLLSQFQAQTSSINGDLGQLITFRNIGGGRAAGFNGICNSNVDQSLCVSGNMTNSITPFPTYSWNVMVVTHEFGHLFGSRHTHACVWNGNNTAIDGCAGGTEGSCPTPGFPSGGGTIMSYCHVQSVGINFNNGFGPQPGNVIRNIVNNATCLSSCCPTDLTITANVNNGNVDHQEAENTITALNTVNSGAEAVYHAGDEVLLLDDFTAIAGSEFRAYIEGCTGIFVKSSVENTDLSGNSSEALSPSLMGALTLSPNPMREKFTIDLTKSEADWDVSEIEIYNMNGQLIQTVDLFEEGKNTFKVNASQLEKGVYVVKLIDAETNESYVRRVVKL
ncbi:MAG: zinc-dependent metalloprotease [Crocinitomicaceae bacterium]